MDTGETKSTLLMNLPLWQVMLVLVGMPALYMANSFLPWSIGLLDRHDHALFLQSWGVIAALHWGSVALVVVLLKRAGRRLADIGMGFSSLRVAMMVGIPVILGLTLIMLHEVSRVSSQGPASESSAAVSPATSGERVFWIFMSFTAGFCEESIYRGFGIRVLQGRNMRTWLAVGLATLAFVLMHGKNVMRLSPFLAIFTAGLLFSALFLWRRSLVPGVVLHTSIDLASIGVP